MSELSLNRLHQEFLAKVHQACAEDRGLDLLTEFHRSMAIDFADCIFLKMDAAVQTLKFETTEQAFAWADEFPQAAGLQLLEGIRTTHQAFGMAGSAEAAQIEAAAMEAYVGRLNLHFDTAYAGGAA